LIRKNIKILSARSRSKIFPELFRGTVCCFDIP